MSGGDDRLAPAADDSAAPAVAIEQELRRMVDSFTLEHASLVRRACRVPVDVVDLSPVVLATLFGYTLDKMRSLHGRAHTERVAIALLDQLDQAHEQVDETRAGADNRLTKGAMH